MTSLDPNLDPASYDLRGKKGSKVPLIVGGIAVVGGLGFFGFSSMRAHEQRKAHAAFIESFAEAEKSDLGKFWGCLLGDKTDPAQLTDNLTLNSRITMMFGFDPKNYPAKVREECTPKAVDAAKKLGALEGPADYTDALATYSKAIRAFADSLDAWTKVAPSMARDVELGKKVASAGAAYHSHPGGKPAPEVGAFDQFLHCAVTGVDGFKDTQAVVELLFKECKRPEYLATLADKCGGLLLEDPPLPATKSFAATQGKLGGDDRELAAFDDCLRKGRKGKRQDDFTEVGKTFVAMQEAAHKVREIGKEALKE